MLLLRVLSLSLTLAAAAGWEQFRNRLPNGSGVPNARAIGHNVPDGSGGMNAFGSDFATLGQDWTLELCRADSDGDGQTNGEELGDPCCTWSQADYPRPHRVSGLSHPGDATKTSDPALWTSLNCTEYRQLVDKVIGRLTSTSAAATTAASARFEAASCVTAVSIVLLALQTLA